MLPLALRLVLTFFFFFTVRADCSVTGCLQAISIIMLERDRDPFLPPALPPHTASQRDDTSPPARLPALLIPHSPHLVCYLLAHRVFSPGGVVFFFFFCDTDNLGGSLKVCVFFPRVPRLADSPTRLLHQRTAGWGLGRRRCLDGCLGSIHLKHCYGFLLSSFMMAAAAASKPPHLCLWCCNRPRLQSDTRLCVLREETAEPGSNSHMGLYSRPAGGFLDKRTVIYLKIHESPH